MPSVRITRGRFTAVWHVLRTVKKLGDRATTGEVFSYARQSSLRAGGLPISDGLRLAREGRFVIESAGAVSLAELGHRALSLAEEDEPPLSAVRLFASVLLLRDPPPWVSWWQGSPDDLELVIPDGERRVMADAGLFPAPDASVDLAAWAWWKALERVPLAEQTAIQRKHIGDAGEQLTVHHERLRLREQGYPELAEGVTWVAQESDAYGFDVLSFAGNEHVGDPCTAIAIEVKSSALPRAERFPLFLTSHEWQTAVTLGPRYVVHLWAAVDPGPPPRARDPQPIVLPHDALANHLPAAPSCGDACDWQSARVELPLSV